MQHLTRTVRLSEQIDPEESNTAGLKIAALGAAACPRRAAGGAAR